jgi:hypothetical protein
LGWQEVKVWVPKEQDARDIRVLAAERRAKVGALDGLSKEIENVTLETETRIAEAIAQHGSAAFNHSSGAVLDLMTNLADAGDLEGLSKAFVMLARAKPAKAAFIANLVPAKVSNFLVKHRGIDAVALDAWCERNQGWTERLKSSLRDPAHFVSTVGSIAEEISGSGKAVGIRRQRSSTGRWPSSQVGTSSGSTP